MKKQYLDLNPAVPPMPDSFTDRMRSTLAQLESPKRRAARPRPAIALAAALVAVLMATVAVAQAVDSGLLARLFGGNEPSRQAQSLLQTGVDSVSREGVTLTVDELLFDGRSLNCDWTLSSDREGMVYLLTGMRLEGVPEEIIESGGGLGMSSSDNMGGDSLALLGDTDGFSAAAEQKGFLRINFKEPLTEEASLTLTVYAYTSGLVPAAIDELYPDARLSAQLEANGEIGAYSSEGRYIAHLSEYPSFTRALSALFGQQADWDQADWDQANIDAHEASGLMQSLTQLELRLPLIPDPSTTTAFGPETFELDNCRVEVHSLSFSTALTCASISVYPKEALSREELFMNYQFFLTDDQGNPLLMDAQGRLIDGEAGVACYEMELSGAPLAEIPDSIHLIRVSGRKEGEGVVSHYKRLFAEAPAGERAVMQLR